MAQVPRLLMSPAAMDAEHWITVHPNGKEDKGQPLLVEGGAGGSVTVKGGAGGKLNGQTLSPGSMSKPRAGTEAPPESESSKASKHANSLTATAQSSSDHESARNAHLAAYRAHKAEGQGNTEVARNHYMQHLEHEGKRVEALKGENRKAGAAKRAAIKAAPSDHPHKRFASAPVEDIDRHFGDRFGIKFSNGIPKSAIAQAKKDYFSHDIEARQKAHEVLGKEGARIRSHTGVDITQSSAAATAQRKMLGVMDDALSDMDSRGWNVKEAMRGRGVVIQAGSTGKANGHAWIGRDGVGHFAVSLAKRLEEDPRQLAAARSRAAAGMPVWSISSTEGEDASRATIIHELAHAIGLQSNVNSPKHLSDAFNQAIADGQVTHHPEDIAKYEKFAGSNIDYMKLAWIKRNISEYAASNGREFDAELCAKVTSPNYQRGTLPKALEDHVDWLFKKRT